MAKVTIQHYQKKRRVKPTDAEWEFIDIEVGETIELEPKDDPLQTFKELQERVEKRLRIAVKKARNGDTA